MAEWVGTILTTAGRNLLAKTIAGQTVHFSRACFGDGVPATGTDIYGMTNVVNAKLNLPARSIDVVGDGTARIELQLTNQTLTEGFHAREIGIFAMDGETEILFAYDNSGDKCDYIPAWGSINPINLFLYAYVVIDSAKSVTINIDNSLLFATIEDLNAHKDAADHPYFGPTATTGTTLLTADDTGNKLHRISLDDTRTLILGDSAATIPVLRSRVSQLEIEQDNMMLKMVADDDCPDSNLRLAEDFKTPDKVDTFSVQVINATAGSATIGVASLSGVIPGAWYRITDGVQDEAFQVKSVAKNGSTFRITAAANLVNTYDLTHCNVWRTTAQIDSTSGTVYGSGDQLGFVAKFDGGVWSGATASTAITSALDTSQSAADNFTADNGVIYTDDGLISMNPVQAYGIALIATGGRVGTWARVNADGDDL